VSRLRIAVINGPNLNLLGSREPEVYGSATLADIEAHLKTVAQELDVALECYQFNGEGEIIDAIHALRRPQDNAPLGVVINAGAYSHSSLAIRDALTGINAPFVEVHLSNVHAREPERHHLMLAPKAVGVICGLGAYGYEAALRGLVHKLRA
jgi:3-dehydroquinate dehydratase-2